MDDIIKQSLLSQLETIKADDDEAKEALEKHQQQTLASYQDKEKKLEEEENEHKIALEEQKERMDAVVAKIDKIKQENASILDGKGKPKLVQDKKKDGAKDDDSSSEDDGAEY